MIASVEPGQTWMHVWNYTPLARRLYLVLNVDDTSARLLDLESGEVCNGYPTLYFALPDEWQRIT